MELAFRYVEDVLYTLEYNDGKYRIYRDGLELIKEFYIEDYAWNYFRKEIK